MAVHRDFGVKNGFFFWENGRGEGLWVKNVFFGVQNDFWVKHVVWEKMARQRDFRVKMAMQRDFWVKDGVWEKIAVQRDFGVKDGVLG